MKKKHKTISLNSFIYVLSDDSIEEGDWCYGVQEDGSYGLHECYSEKRVVALSVIGAKKIIATTDPKLKTDNTGVRTPSVPIPRIPQSLIEYYAKHQPEEVELEYEYNDNMPLTTPGSSVYIPKLRNNEVVWAEHSLKDGLKKVIDRIDAMIGDRTKRYTREEVEELCERALVHGTNCSVALEDEKRFVEQWIKENL